MPNANALENFGFDEYPNFQARVELTVKEIRRLPKAEPWHDTLAAFKDSQIVQLMNTFTISTFKDLLNSESPPTLRDLMTLNWTDTDQPGAYLKIIYQDKIVNAEDKPHWLYVGSATGKYNRGLRGRKRNHETKPTTSM